MVKLEMSKKQNDLLNIEIKGHFIHQNEKLNILIFSKDRALQLDSLLRSIKDNFLVPFHSVTVLYLFTNEIFKSGYQKLIQSSSTYKFFIKWVEQGNFHDDTYRIIDIYRRDSLVMFLVDDDIFYRPFNNGNILNQIRGNVLFANLIFFQNPEKNKWLHTHEKNGVISYLWLKRSKKNVYQCYPFSLDAHIYRVSVIKKLIMKLQYKAPNSLEGALHKCKRKLGLMRYWRALAHNEAVVFNNPLNSVQLEGATWNKEISIEMLNAKYLDGYQIDNKKIYNAKPDQEHFYFPVTLIKE